MGLEPVILLFQLPRVSLSTYSHFTGEWSHCRPTEDWRKPPAVSLSLSLTHCDVWYLWVRSAAIHWFFKQNLTLLLAVPIFWVSINTYKLFIIETDWDLSAFVKYQCNVKCPGIFYYLPFTSQSIEKQMDTFLHLCVVAFPFLYSSTCSDYVGCGMTSFRTWNALPHLWT